MVAAALSTVLTVSGCGGGSDDNASQPQTPVTQPATPSGAGDKAPPNTSPSSPTTPSTAAQGCASGGAFPHIVYDGAIVGQQATAGILGCKGPLDKLHWTQTSGPKVGLLGTEAQLISFVPTQAASYTFHVSFTDGDGAAQAQDITLNISAPEQPAKIIVPSHQAVRMGGGVSMRAWSASGAPISDVNWTQVDGPTVQLKAVDKAGNSAQQFVAPVVKEDTVLRFRATVQDRGASVSQDVVVLVEKYDQAAEGDTTHLFAGTHVSRVHAYKPGATYAGLLASCVYNAALTNENSCTVGQLPLLGQETGGAMPTIDQVMSRVLVSETWQGRNFETFLRTWDTRGDFRMMLRSVRAVVIGNHVRPSFFMTLTGAINLDADNLWMKPGERDGIDETPDYRLAFASKLPYVLPSRYVKDGTEYTPVFPLTKRLSRDENGLGPKLADLLYHELAHANDFLPEETYTVLTKQPSMKINDFIKDRTSKHALTSDLMTTKYPLTDATLHLLGQVEYAGGKVTDELKALSADQIGAKFEADLASAFYAYSTPLEDLAMTVEEAMMSVRLGAQRDAGIIANDGVGGVRWGERGRVGDPKLHDRLALAGEKIVPWMNQSTFGTLPSPQKMRVGDSWTANLNLHAPTASVMRQVNVGSDEADEEERLKETLRQELDRAEGHRINKRWLNSH